MVGAAESALRSVPQDYRDASYAMGATRWQTIYKVVLPAGFSSILTGESSASGVWRGRRRPTSSPGAAFYAPHGRRASSGGHGPAVPHSRSGHGGDQHRMTRHPVRTVLVLLIIVL
jgi:phosphate transport system permease protein